MSKIEVINFEEKVRKMKRSSKVNGFSGMIKMLRHSVDVFEFVGEDVEERLQKYSNLVGKDSKDFMLNPTDMKDSWNSLSCGNPAIFNFMSKEVNKEKYHLRICYNPVAESVATSFSKLSNGLPVAQYDSENNIWISHTGPEISEKFAKILDSGSPEADILEFLLDSLIILQRRIIRESSRNIRNCFLCTIRQIVTWNQFSLFQNLQKKRTM